MPKLSPAVRILRRLAIPGAALVLAIVSVAYGMGSCAQEQRKRAYIERQAPLVKAWKKHRPLLARAAALQPNFKELTTEIAPSRCRELRDLARARYELDPFRIEGRCGDEDVTAELEICEAARVFADLGGAETQQGRRVGVILQSRKRHEAVGEPRLEVTTLLLADDHSILEVHELSFGGDSMNAKPQTTRIRATGPDGLFERVDRGERTELRATTPDGAVQLFRVKAGTRGERVERIRGAGTEGWSQVHRLPTVGAWYATLSGLACAPPSWSELEIERRESSVVCTRVRLHERGSSETWSRGKGCDSGS